MSQLIKIVYVGKKPVAYDNVSGSGKVWTGQGDVQEVTQTQAKILLKYPDQWDVVDADDAGIVHEPITVGVTGEDGQTQQVDESALDKPLEKMSKAELVAFAKAKYGKKLDARKSSKDLIDAIEEFMRDLEPLPAGATIDNEQPSADGVTGEDPDEQKAA